MKELTAEEIQTKAKFYNEIVGCCDWICAKLVQNNVAPREFFEHYITTLPNREWILNHYLQWEKKEKEKVKNKK